VIDLANHVAQGWWGWMGPMLWQASLLIMIVSLIDLLIRRWAWPQVRYALWLLVLIKLLIPPTWSLPSGVISQARPWAEKRIEHVWIAERQESSGAAERKEAELPLPVGRDASHSGAPTARPAWQLWAMAAWILGMLAFAALLLTRILKLRRWHKAQKRRRKIPGWFHELLVECARKLKLGRLPAIVFSEQAVTPAVYGLFRPVLLLPRDYTDSLSREEAEHVLLHELAHLKRGDLWLHGLTLLLQVVYWFNPLLAWAGRQMKHVREICCDLTIANLLRERTMKYRQTLLNTARELLTESLEPGMGLLGVFEEPFRLVARLRWLEKKTWLKRGWMAAAAALVLVVAVPCILPMALAEQGAEGGATTTIEQPQPEDATAAGKTVAARNGSEEVYYVKEVTSAKDYFLFFERGKKVAGVNELWFGDRRALSTEGGKTVLLDLEKGMVTFINHENKSYVETPHPAEITDLLANELQWRHPLPQTDGVVEAREGTRTILDRPCKEYEVNFWTVAGKERVDQRTITVWASTDMPFDVNLFHELIEDKRRFANRDDDYRAELKKLEGIQMGLRMETGPFWASRIWRSEVVEITRKKPPEGLWTVPAGYTRKERLAREDFY
jgi:beta-lactamase regulating signal transducer with metallopeptidase domain